MNIQEIIEKKKRLSASELQATYYTYIESSEYRGLAVIDNEDTDGEVGYFYFFKDKNIDFNSYEKININELIIIVALSDDEVMQLNGQAS